MMLPDVLAAAIALNHFRAFSILHAFCATIPLATVFFAVIANAITILIYRIGAIFHIAAVRFIIANSVAILVGQITRGFLIGLRSLYIC